MPLFSPDRILRALDAFPGAGCCGVALSGGMDSLVLLHALASLRPGLACELRAAHVDHGLHPQAPRWADHCRRACEALGVPLAVLCVDASPAAGESPEAAAREARYRALMGLMAPGDLLLTAQHRDDQAETLLLALLRGSGPKGLAAMPAAASFGPGHLLRPLLAFDRADLAAYAQSVGLTWVEDPSNADLTRDRNFIRHRVLPLLAERWPACTATIARSAGHCAEAQGLVDRLTEDALAGVHGSRPGTLSVSGVDALDAALARAVLRHWIAGRGLALPDAGRIGRILSEVIPARPDAAPLVAWRGCEVRRYRDDLYAIAPLPPRPGPEPISWRTGVLELPNGLGRLAWTDGEGTVIDPVTVHPGGLTVCFGAAGLTCRPSGKEHHRTLKNLFQEAGVPGWLRPYVPLILEDEGLVAVGGLVSCDRAGAAEVEWRGHHWETQGVFPGAQALRLTTHRRRG